MNYKNTTQVPNLVFDYLLPKLTEAELKIILIVIRQTFGWLNPRTMQRKVRDRITHAQFAKKSGLSRRTVAKTVARLIDMNFISATDNKGNDLPAAVQRKGKKRLYYALKSPTERVGATKGKTMHISAYLVPIK